MVHTKKGSSVPPQFSQAKTHIRYGIGRGVRRESAFIETKGTQECDGRTGTGSRRRVDYVPFSYPRCAPLFVWLVLALLFLPRHKLERTRGESRCAPEQRGRVRQGTSAPPSPYVIILFSMKFIPINRFSISNLCIHDSLKIW